MASTRTTKQAGNADDAAAEDAVALYTLPELVTRLGKASDEEIHVYVEGHSKADLIAEGATTGTGRIDTDCARLYGVAADFFDHATATQRGHVVGVSPKMLRAAVSAAQRGSELAARRESAKSKSNAAKGERTAAAGDLRDKAFLRRRVLRSGLRTLAAGQSAWLTAIDTAMGTADTVKNLADALDALVSVGRRMLRRPSAGIKERLTDSGLTAALLDESAALAEALRGAGDAAEAVASKGSVSQAEVDYWDGINLMLLGSFIEVFDAAHEVDPTVPRLVPITLRNYFNRTRNRSKKAEDTAPASPT